MTNVLILGVGPLPVDESDRLFAPGLRCWHMAELLARKRHRVLVAVIEFGDFDAGRGTGVSGATREEAGEFITIVRMGYDPDRNREALATLIRSGQIEAVVSTTDIMNHLAAGLPGHLPVWMDFNGDPFAEKQMMGAVSGNDATLFNQWSLLLPALARGDRFSTASRSQRLALIGQLAFAGRLNEHTAGEELVHELVPCSRAMLNFGMGNPYAVKSRLVPTESFMVLWTGGYNNWVDPDTMAEGLLTAMRADETIYFVSTGGGIQGHETKTFERFRSRVEASGMETRFQFLGWIPTDSIPSIYRQADLALCVDRDCHEGELGHRNRVVDWMLFGVPVLATASCDFTADLANLGVIRTFEAGNADSLCREILAARAAQAGLKAEARRAREALDTHYDEENMFRALLEWVAAPVQAGDRGAGMDTAGAGLGGMLMGLMAQPADEKGKGPGLMGRLKARIMGRR